MKHKPVLQARRNQFADYKQLRDRDFQSVHEELTHLRTSVRDLEKIVVLLKAEKNRLSAELLTKGKELDHLHALLNANVLRKPNSVEELTVADELRRQVASLESELSELRAANVQQEVQEALITGNAVREEQLVSDLRNELAILQERSATTAESASAKDHDIARLTADIQRLNDEMIVRTKRLKLEVEEAVKVGKLDARAEITSLHDEIEAWKRRVDEANDAVSLKESEAARAKEQLYQQQKVSNDEVSERTRMTAEIKRLELLVKDVDALRHQIDQFRDANTAADIQLRERVAVADLERHEMKQAQRNFLLEVEHLKDDLAAQEREVLQVRRNAEKRVLEAKLDPDSEVIQQMNLLKAEVQEAKAGSAALREQLLASQASAHMQTELIKLHEGDKLSKTSALTTAEAALTKLRAELFQSKADLSTATLQLDELRKREQLLSQEKAVAQRDNAEAVHVIDALEDKILELQHTIDTEFVIQHEALLLELNQWKTKFTALDQQAQHDMAAVRETVDQQLAQQQQQLLAAASDLEKEKARSQDLVQQLAMDEIEDQRQLAAVAQHFDGLLAAAHATEAALRQEIAATADSRTQSVSALQEQIATLTARASEKDAQVAQLQAEIAEKVGAAQVSLEATKTVQTHVDALSKQVQTLTDEKAAFNKRKATWSLEKEALVEKVKGLETHLADVESSLSKRDGMLQKEVQDRKSAVQAETQLAEKTRKEHEEKVTELETKTQALEKELKEFRDREPTTYEVSLKNRVKELTEENQRLRTVQMTW